MGITRWVSVYDFPRRLCEIVRADQPERHWTGLMLDPAVSDANGDFAVYRSEEGDIIRVSIRLDDRGDLAARHPDFDDRVIGSLTVWPAGSVGGLAPVFTWWSEGDMWTSGEPRAWMGGSPDPLLELAQVMSGEAVQHAPGEIAFTTDYADIVGTHQRGSCSLRIRAYLGRAEPDEVVDWMDRQPPPLSGILQAIEDEGEVEPRLLFERPVGKVDWSTDLLPQEVEEYAAAWKEDRVADQSNYSGSFEIADDPRDTVPSSAWLLLGDEASFPDAGELSELRDRGDVGIFDYLWTSAKQTLAGDLVLVYFHGARKSAHFIARAASNAFFTDDLEVNSETGVARQQWWTHLTPLVEIEPISFAALKAATEGHLILRGRSGKYLHPGIVSKLTVRAKDTARQAEVDRIWRVPSGLPDLPQPEDVDVEGWAAQAAGALPLEAHVSRHVVEPLLRHALLGTELTWGREYRAGRGYVDFIVLDGERPVCAIEVKLIVDTPPGASWAGSKDVHQLRRYMSSLGVPGLLIDAHRVLLVHQDETQPISAVERRTFTDEGLEQIRRHLLPT